VRSEFLVPLACSEIPWASFLARSRSSSECIRGSYLPGAGESTPCFLTFPNCSRTLIAHCDKLPICRYLQTLCRSFAAEAATVDLPEISWQTALQLALECVDSVGDRRLVCHACDRRATGPASASERAAGPSRCRQEGVRFVIDFGPQSAATARTPSRWPSSGKTCLPLTSTGAVSSKATETPFTDGNPSLTFGGSREEVPS
jgi:hypothetical protein